VQGLGEPLNADFNGDTQRGVGFYQFMNRYRKRSSAADAYISPMENNPNLSVQLHTEVIRIVLDGNRAVGVEYVDKSGARHIAHCAADVILSAGALVTPKILMLSGIGPAEHLIGHEIPVKIDLPGGGQHLIDHPEVPISALANGPYGYYKKGVGWRMLKNGLLFKLFGSGPITTAGVEAGAFVNPTDPESPPTVQASPPSERIKRIALPSPDDLSDDALAEHCKRFVKTNYHPASSARMGADGDPMAVLDAKLRVRGIDNLRVCDMSAVPNINAGNTNAPAMMIGHRCADFILASDDAA